MDRLHPKKKLGQHFLVDKNIAEKIVHSLTTNGYHSVLEVGPGMGILSDFLFNNKHFQATLVDIDPESILYLHQRYPKHVERILEADFLKFDFDHYFPNQVALIGNFPYNISSQILFKVLENKLKIPELVGMFQKEVAERFVAKPSSKAYGILSVLTQAYYHVEYLFTVKPTVFFPPPKVQSAVIRMQRKANFTLPCDEILFWKIVKAGFNQRRKTLRNALHLLLEKDQMTEAVFTYRAEALRVEDFIALTQLISRLRQESTKL